VAISRARCLAYLVCTEGLLNTRARTVPEMRLLSTLSAFVEWTQRQAVRNLEKSSVSRCKLNLLHEMPSPSSD
jgi:hypothetical protein